MPLFRYSINVPNPTQKPATVQLRLKRLKKAELKALKLDLPPRDLKVTSATLAEDPCSSAGGNTLVVKLKPLSSANVYVSIVTVGAKPKSGGIAAFRLIDYREETPNRGVTIMCVDQAKPQAPGQVVSTSRPCPIVLARKAYPVAPGSDPRQQPANTAVLLGSVVELVAPVINPMSTKLQGVQVYLEHLGECDASFQPNTWNVGQLEPQDVFYATWLIEANGSLTGTFVGSVVVASQRTNPVRLPVTMQFAPKSTRTGGPSK